jgi:hypothetical protein
MFRSANPSLANFRVAAALLARADEMIELRSFWRRTLLHLLRSGIGHLAAVRECPLYVSSGG